MKRFVAVLLCILMILPLSSCNQNFFSDTPQGETSNPPIPANYESTIALYNKVIQFCRTYSRWDDIKKADLNMVNITDAREKEVFSRLLYSAYHFYPYTDTLTPSSSAYKQFSGYSEKDLNGDGVNELIILCDYSVLAIFSSCNGSPILLQNYTTSDTVWIDANGYIHERKNKDTAKFAHEVYQIAKNGASLELIEEFGIRSDTVENYIFQYNYYKLAEGERTEINESAYLVLEHQYGKYTNRDACIEITKASLESSFTPLVSHKQIVAEAYEAVLQNESLIHDSNTGRLLYLMSYVLPVAKIPLYEKKELKHTYIDMDGDSVNEMVIDCGELLILKYSDGLVHLYPYFDENMTHLNSDGSYAWRQTTEQGTKYGETEIVFHTHSVAAMELWSVEDNGAPNVFYIINGAAATQEKMQTYWDSHPKTKIDLSPLEVSWNQLLSKEEAKEIVAKLWGYKDSEILYGPNPNIINVMRFEAMDFYKNREIYFRITAYIDHYYAPLTEDKEPYGSHFNDEILVNRLTGECIPVPSIDDGK